MWGQEPKIDRKTLSDKQEARLAEEMGFKQTKGSGNQRWPSMKGDGDWPGYKVELKRSKKDSICVDAQVIRKITREATKVGKEPMLLVTADGMPEPLDKDWAIIPARVLRGLLQAAGQI